MIRLTLRIEGEGEPPEELSRLLSDAEALISDGLPEDWYAKIEDEPAAQKIPKGARKKPSDRG